MHDPLHTACGQSQQAMPGERDVRLSADKSVAAGLERQYRSLLRQYFPKGTDLSRHPAKELNAVAQAVITRPRKTLGWKTRAEALDQFLRSDASVATTG